MKKIILLVLCYTCFNAANAQLTTDTLTIKQKQPWLIPNVGYSLLEGKYFKIGTWVKLSNNINLEIDYSLLPKSPFNQSIHKAFAGINFFPIEKNRFFFSFSTTILQVFKKRLNVPFTYNYYYETRTSYFLDREDNPKFSFCCGNKFDFGCKKKYGLLIKYGLMTPVWLGGNELKVPILFNLECSFLINLFK